jgi:hypothetical protein
MTKKYSLGFRESIRKLIPPTVPIFGQNSCFLLEILYFENGKTYLREELNMQANVPIPPPQDSTGF